MNNNTLYHPNFTDGRIQPITPFPESMQHSNSIIQSDNGFHIGVTPGAVVGALVGGAIAKHQAEKEIAERNRQNQLMADRNAPNIDGNYYNQVGHVAENLQVFHLFPYGQMTHALHKITQIQ